MEPGGGCRTRGRCTRTLTSIQSCILWLFGFSFSSLSICLHSSSEVSSLRLGVSELSPTVYSSFWGSGQSRAVKGSTGERYAPGSRPPLPQGSPSLSLPLSSHLLGDKFVDILVLGQEFLPAQAPVPPQLAGGLLALQDRQAVSTGTPCPPSPGSGIQRLGHATPGTRTWQGKPPAIPSGGRGARSLHANLPPRAGCRSPGQRRQLREPHALTMPLHNKPSTSTSSVVAFPMGTRGFVISLRGTRPS